ncbi:MAG: hypothetical protein WBP47_27260 [Candidatus Promineifilaceae bacterium]
MSCIPPIITLKQLQTSRAHVGRADLLEPGVGAAFADDLPAQRRRRAPAVFHNVPGAAGQQYDRVFFFVSRRHG